MGKNLLVAYMPYHGLNFEDAIVISDRLYKEDILTSVHYHYLKTEVYADKYLEIKQKTGDYIEPGMIWCTRHSKSSGEDISCTVPAEAKGTIISIDKISLNGKVLQENEDYPYREPMDPNRKLGIVKLAIREYRKIQLGDKLTGRHGNKGVIGAIIPEEKMPHLPNGEPVDVILNPHGVISRMNLGQLLETHYGLLSKYKELKKPDGSNLFTDIEKNIIENTGKAFQRHDDLMLSSLLRKLLDALFPEEKSEPHSQGKVRLRDGRNGKLFDNPSVIGYQYMLKLNHLSE